MNSKDFETRLRQSLHQAPPTANDEAYISTILLARKMSVQQQRTRVSFRQFLIMQIRFIGWKVWGIQGTFLLVICGILSRVFDSLEDPLFSVKLLLCLSVLVFSMALPFVCRSNRYRMQEIEAASRFSSVALLMAKFMVIGIGDLGMLGGIFMITLMKSSIGAGSALLYVSFPFLLACCWCLYMLGHLAPNWAFAGSSGFSAFLVLSFASIPRQCIPTQSVPVFWIGVCLGLALLCIYQFRYILCRSSYTEKQIA